MEFKFLLRLFLKFRAILPLFGGSVAWGSMYLFAWWIGMPLVVISQVAGPVALAGAVLAWIIDIRWGVTTGLYRQHFQHKRDLAETSYASGELGAEEALLLYFPAALELVVAQQAVLFAPRAAKNRLKRRLWVIENVLPLLWGKHGFDPPTTFKGWLDLVDELADSYATVQDSMTIGERLRRAMRLRQGPSMASLVVDEWVIRHVKSRLTREDQPHRPIALLPAPSVPIGDIFAAVDQRVRVPPPE